MTRENKLALIVGFSLLLVVAVLLADHLSPAQRNQLAMLDAPTDTGPALPAGNGQPVRQFGSGEPQQQQAPQQPAVRLIDPPRSAMQTDRNVQNGETMTPEVEGVNRLRRSGFEEQMETNTEAAAAIEMGARPNLPAGGGRDEPRQDRGDAQAYTVKEGDTLYGLCKQFYGSGGLYEQLARFNGDAVPASGQIRKGMTLWIPSREVLDGRAPSKPPKTTSQPPADRAKPSVKTVSYTIREDDRLWDIAKEHLGKGHRWPEIVELNKDIIKNPNVLPVGKTIRIPVR